MPNENDTSSVFMIPYTKGATGRMKKQETDLNNKTHEYIKFMTEMRESIVKNIFKNTDNKKVHIPVAFQSYY